MRSTDYDFSGWATRNDIRCADGLTIRQDAFADCDGMEVPLVYMHDHKDPENVLGHALLENRDEGVYCYGRFNEDTKQGQMAKALVSHGDITSLSIFANQLVKKGSDVLHGAIREVSLVLAGANPGATIDFPILQHSDGSYEDIETEAIISFSQPLSISEECAHYLDDDEYSLYHADDDDDDDDDNEDDPTVEEVMDTFDEDQKKLLEGMMTLSYQQGYEDAMNGEGAEEGEEDEEIEQSAIGGNEMYRNVFERDTYDTLQHGIDAEDAMAILQECETSHGSLKNTTLAHGIDQIDWLFPEAKTATATPGWIKRDMGWVAGVMGGVHHVPYSRIKSMFADIREDEARAKGYIKDEYKKEEVFSLLKRSTTPQTVYKKQKLDRDDIIDITDFDVVAWIKAEMRMMLDEEIARAIMIGDGRLASSEDKIKEEHVRPIWKEADLFCIKKEVPIGADDDATAKNFIRTAIKARKDYRGSGNPVLFTTEDFLTDMLLLEDSIGHALYETEAQLATKLRVSKIVTVPVMENLTRQVIKSGQAYTNTLMGIIINLNDYNVGADKGGAVSMFDDFDIDFNQMKYLMETRISGAMTKPFSAIVLEKSVQGAG